MTEITVLMPVYNGEKHVRHAITSILNQTFEDFEFLIIDDGSIDSTLTILREFEKVDRRIRIVSRANKANKGLVASLNEGVELSSSPLIARMDHDDISFPERLEKQFDFMSKNPHVVCCGGALEFVDDKGRAITLIKTPISHAEIYDKLISGHTAICHPAAIYRKNEVIQAGKYSPDFYPAEDYHLWLKLSELGQLRNLDVPVIKYRFCENSISALNINKQMAAIKRACEMAWVKHNVNQVKRRFSGNSAWRTSDERSSKSEFKLKFGWWAFNYQKRKTAFIYATHALYLNPFVKDAWTLLYCCLVKPLPAKGT